MVHGRAALGSTWCGLLSDPQTRLFTTERSQASLKLSVPLPGKLGGLSGAGLEGKMAAGGICFWWEEVDGQGDCL